MEIEITSLLAIDQFPLSHSAAEGGETAGRDTWRNSLDAAADTPLLDTPEKLQAMRDFARSSGGWDSEEIAAWSDQEVNALFLQWIAGDCRQCPATLEGVEFEERAPEAISRDETEEWLNGLGVPFEELESNGGRIPDDWEDLEHGEGYGSWMKRHDPVAFNMAVHERQPADTLEWWHSHEDTPDMETGPFDSRSDAYADACPQRAPRADSLDEIDWQEYEAQADAGRIPGNLSRADDGRIYFYLGN